MDYKQKYLKYKNKYNKLKNVLHGGNITEEDMKAGIVIINGSTNTLNNTSEIITFIRDKIMSF